MNNKSEKHNIFWKLAVVALIAVVGLQALVMYYAIIKKDTPKRTQTSFEDVVLQPRASSPMQYQQQAIPTPTIAVAPQSQSLKPPPLPKLNLNLNTMPGVQASQQAMLQQQQTAKSLAPVFSRSTRPGMNQRMPGMSGFSGMNIQEEFERMQKMMDSMFNNRGMSAAMNRHSNARGLSMKAVAPTLSQQGDNYVVKLTIPGLDKSEINAEVRNNILTLSGVQKEEVENNSQYGRTYSSSSSSFQNSFSLPGPIKSDGLKVDYQGNTLTVTVPKA